MGLATFHKSTQYTSKCLCITRNCMLSFSLRRLNNVHMFYKKYPSCQVIFTILRDCAHLKYLPAQKNTVLPIEQE